MKTSICSKVFNLVRDKRKDISDAEIAGYYLGITKVPVRICSPLRQDTKPSFGIYTRDGEHIYYTDFAIKAFRTYLCMMILACVNKACFIFLQAMGKAAASTALSMIREVVFGVGFALLLPVFLGLDGVLYSMPVSDILTFIIAAFLIIRTYKELNVKGENTL